MTEQPKRTGPTVDSLRRRMDEYEKAPEMRVEKHVGTAENGRATVTFPAFREPPSGTVVETWLGDQKVSGEVLSTTHTTATVAVMKSRGAVLLNRSPFETAPDGTKVTVQVIGK